jgi:hypothetical protein
LLFDAELSAEEDGDELDVFELELDVPDDGVLEWLQPNKASRANTASPRNIFCFRMFFTPDST